MTSVINLNQRNLEIQINTESLADNNTESLVDNNTESSASVLFLHLDITVRDIYEVKAYRDVTVT